jgi:diadenosine tetraphosphate (Ap4A) HIT family hydrolase
VVDSELGRDEIVSAASCVFCDILLGNAQSSMVYTDDRVAAFMDIRPVSPGHMLVVPRDHAPHLADLEPAVGGHILQVAMLLAAAVRKTSIRCDGINLILADGQAAGQEVFHVHLHVIPRFYGDGFGFRFGPDYAQLPDRASLDQAAMAVRQALEV